MALASRLMIAAVLGMGAAPLAAEDAERSVRQVRFAAGTSATTLKDSVQGRKYVDYQLRAGAGQVLKVSMKAGSGSGAFNVLPPESRDAAMFIEGGGARAFEGRLPADGVYTVRVYLTRAAARRNESASYTLSIGVTGKALAPLPAARDALVPGTAFHATAKVRCEPPYTKTRECDAGVIRRGNDGTASVDLRWDTNGRRRILFVGGRPEASDDPRPFAHTRSERGTVVEFAPDERFEIPEALVNGG